jgi:ABC-type molybdate transport system permease subunit
MVVFTVLGLISNFLFGRSGAVIRIQYEDGHSAFTLAGIACLALFLGLPLLGVVLGLLGRLPGTKRVTSELA